MTKVMVTIRSIEGAPTIAELCQEYGLEESDFDADFGVVEIDPDDHAYTVLVRPAAAALLQPTEDWDVEGPFSNVRIEPFGPPEAEDPSPCSQDEAG